MIVKILYYCNLINFWKKLYKKFDALIYFNDNFQVNKSIKTVKLNSEKKKMIESKKIIGNILNLFILFSLS